MPKQFNRFIKGVWRFLSLNLHTLLFLLGLILYQYRRLYGRDDFGIAASGVLLVFVAILLNHETERG
ncbi:hypothetical protein ACEQPO_11175 [Bacillus sp. SL00103]